MLTPEERERTIARIRNLPAALEAAVDSLTEEQLNSPSSEGEWTIRQVVHHLADANLNFFARTKWILSEEKPVLKVFDQEKWATLADTNSPTQTSLLILKGLHQRWVMLLESVPEAGWQRKAIHPEQGEVTLEGVLARYAQHGDTHMEQIAQIRAAKGW